MATLRKKVQLKANILGEGDECVRDVWLLNRKIRLEATGVSMEADERHVEDILRFAEGSWIKHRSVPMDNTVMEKCLQGDEMGREDTTAFRGTAAKLNYLSADRPDLKVAALHASKHADNPKAGAT